MEDKEKISEAVDTNDWPKKLSELNDEHPNKVQQKQPSYEMFVKKIIEKALDNIKQNSNAPKRIMDSYIESMLQDLGAIKNMQITKEEWDAFSKIMNYIIITNNDMIDKGEPITMKMGMVNTFGDFDIHITIKQTEKEQN